MSSDVGKAHRASVLDDVLSLVRKEDDINGFSVSSYVSACRRVYSLKPLSEALRAYGNRLKAELVELLNRDLDQFVSLVTQLEGTDDALKRIEGPLSHVKENVRVVTETLQTQIDILHEFLQQRTDNVQSRERLLSLMEIADAKQVLSTLLLCSDTENDTQNHTNVFSGAQLERIAKSFTRLKILSDRAREAPDVCSLNEVTELETQVENALRSQLLSICNTEDVSDETIRSVLQSFTSCCKTSLAIGVIREHLVHPILSVHLKQLGFGGSGLDRALDEIFVAIERSVGRLSRVGGDRFAFVSEAVWPAVCDSLQEHGSLVFAPGMPVEFHRNYGTVIAFLERLSSLSGSPLLHCPSVQTFLKRFNMRIYFELRKQKIITDFEQSLLSVEGVIDNLLSNVTLCFSPSVFLSPMASAFLGLALRLLRRFCRWCIDSSFTASQALNLLAGIASLTEALKEEIPQQATVAIGEHAETNSIVLSVFENIVASLEEPKNSLRSLAISAVSSACKQALEAVPKIKASYRMTGRQAPTTALPYVKELVRPLQDALVDAEQNAERDSFAASVVLDVSSGYASVVKELLSVVRETEASLRRLGTGSNKFADSSGKILCQLRLDVEVFRSSLDELASGSDWSLSEALAPLDVILQ